MSPRNYIEMNISSISLLDALHINETLRKQYPMIHRSFSLRNFDFAYYFEGTQLIMVGDEGEEPIHADLSFGWDDADAFFQFCAAVKDKTGKVAFLDWFPNLTEKGRLLPTSIYAPNQDVYNLAFYSGLDAVYIHGSMEKIENLRVLIYDSETLEYKTRCIQVDAAEYIQRSIDQMFPIGRNGNPEVAALKALLRSVIASGSLKPTSSLWQKITAAIKQP